MIKEKEVEIEVSRGSLGYYRSLGYNCNKGDKIILQVDELSYGSTVIITAICDNCGKEVPMKYGVYKKGYDKTGSYFCKDCVHIKIAKGVRKANQERHDEIIEKRKNTCIQKYGKDHPMHVDEIKKKQQQTMIDHWGVKTPAESKEIIQRLRENNYKKYGVYNTSQLPEVKEKISNTNILKYGEACVLKVPEIKEKINATIK